jgi:ubiquitin-conjugating enzyme E2 J1
MDTDAKGQVGGMDASEELRRRYAAQSTKSRCAVCAKTNEEIIRELDEIVEAAGGEGKSDEAVPDQLRLAYREDLGKESGGTGDGKTKAAESAVDEPKPTPTRTIPAPASVPAVAAPAAPLLAQRQRPPARQDEDVPAWIDKAIYGVLAALAFLVWKKYLL